MGAPEAEAGPHKGPTSDAPVPPFHEGPAEAVASDIDSTSATTDKKHYFSYTAKIADGRIGIRLGTNSALAGRPDKHKVAAVESDSAFLRGIRIGDLLIVVNGLPVGSLDHKAVISLLKNSERPLVLSLQGDFQHPREAYHTHPDGTRELVRVTKAHSEAEGGGYTICAQCPIAYEFYTLNE